MKCAVCAVEGRIDNAGVIVEGDNSAETPTKVFQKQQFICVNQNCPLYGKDIGEIRHQIFG